MGPSFKPEFVAPPAQVQPVGVKDASMRAARLIEAAMRRCTQEDLRALDCLLEARRALSPIVDEDKPPEILQTRIVKRPHRVHDAAE